MKKTYGRVPKGSSIKVIWQGLSSRNIEMIEEFTSFKKGSVCDQRLEKIFNSLVKFADLLELDFDKATKNDITRAWNVIYSCSLAIKSKQDEYMHIRQGFKHWFGDDEEFPKVVLGMKRPRGRGLLVLPEELPNEELIHKAIKLCTNARNQFFVAYQGLDAGARPIELRMLQWKNLKKDENGYFFRVYTAKKSGTSDYRPIRVIFSEPYLLEWMKDYPGERQDNEYVFCQTDCPTSPVGRQVVTKLFQRLKKKLGMKTKFSAYVLRHATLTRMGKNPQVSEAVLKKFAGHTQTSTIIGEYQHYGGDDIKEMQLGYAGQEAVVKDKSHELTKKPVKCPHCKKTNPWDAEICGFCNFALTQKRNIMAGNYDKYKTTIDALVVSNEQLTQLSEKFEKKVRELQIGNQELAKKFNENKNK